MDSWYKLYKPFPNRWFIIVIPALPDFVGVFFPKLLGEISLGLVDVYPH